LREHQMDQSSYRRRIQRSLVRLSSAIISQERNMGLYSSVVGVIPRVFQAQIRRMGTTLYYLFLTVCKLSVRVTVSESKSN
jgi:hypothetical protein